MRVMLHGTTCLSQSTEHHPRQPSNVNYKHFYSLMLLTSINCLGWLIRRCWQQSCFSSSVLTVVFIRSVHRSINFLRSYSSCISLYVMHVLAFWQVTLINEYEWMNEMIVYDRLWLLISCYCVLRYAPMVFYHACDGGTYYKYDMTGVVEAVSLVPHVTTPYQLRCIVEKCRNKY